MIQYKTNTFKDIYDTPLGQLLWKFLNSREIVIRMETATKLEKPAIEAIDQLLLDEFGDQVINDRVKQMIGSMVRQIMEGHGYTWDRDGVKIKYKVLFSTASRYIK